MSANEDGRRQVEPVRGTADQATQANTWRQQKRRPKQLSATRASQRQAEKKLPAKAPFQRSNHPIVRAIPEGQNSLVAVRLSLMAMASNLLKIPLAQVAGKGRVSESEDERWPPT